MIIGYRHFDGQYDDKSLSDLLSTLQKIHLFPLGFFRAHNQLRFSDSVLR